jgi:DNA-binding transcriptional ArsR family regulator
VSGVLVYNYLVVEMSTPLTVPHPLPPLLTDLIAARFRLLGEPMRIRILDSLRSGAASVGELADTLETTQQNVSKHLTILHRAGIVAREKQGNRVLYSIADPGVFELCEHVCGGLRRQIEELDGLIPGGNR